MLNFDANLEKKLAAEVEVWGPQLVRPWRKPVYRCVNLKWARPEHLISGQGTELFGSRWLAPGHAPAVYVASSEALALKEARQLFSDFGIAKPLQKPRVVVQLDVNLKGMADLTRLPEVTSWPLLKELLSDDWEKANDQGQESFSQLLGRAFWRQRYQGLIVPSARDKRGRNIVIFPETTYYANSVKIAGEKELSDWLKPH